MDPLTALIVIAFAVLAGLMGSLLGLGGGIIIIPALTLALGFSMQEAIGASLIGVIASSTGSASRYVQQGFVNVKLGMLLETPQRSVRSSGRSSPYTPTRRYWPWSSRS